MSGRPIKRTLRGGSIDPGLCFHDACRVRPDSFAPFRPFALD